jgi:hypothetical protein
LASLDSPVSNSNFNKFFQIDGKKDSTYRVVKKNNVEPRKEASPPSEDGREVNLKDVDSCEIYNDKAPGISSDGALMFSDDCASL